jgi:anti-sigma factor RsiW
MTNHLTSEQLIDYLHGELPPGDDASVHVHLETCAACRAEYEAQAVLTESLRAYARQTERELPGAVRGAIWNAVDARSRASFSGRLRAFFRPALGLAVAAAATIAVIAGYSTATHHVPTAIDAVYYLDDHAALTSTVPFHEGSAVPAALTTGQAASDQEWLASSGAGDVAVDVATH